jgi:hypothetical protein
MTFKLNFLFYYLNYEIYFIILIGHGNFLGRREVQDGPYVWQSYIEVQERVANFGSGLSKLGFKPKDILGLFLINTPEYVNIFFQLNIMT